MIKNIVYMMLVIIFNSCSDNAMVTVYDKKVFQENVTCLHLVVFPPDEKITTTLKSLYSFQESCDFSLNISKKSGITCNSTHNVDKKVLSSFPSSYLNMSLYKKGSLVYSYYIDLENGVNESDLKDGFARVKEDLQL